MKTSIVLRIIKQKLLNFKVSQNNLKVLGTKLKDMNIHSNMLIAFIVRNNKQIFPNGNDEIKLGDNVVVVSYKQKLNISMIFLGGNYEL